MVSYDWDISWLKGKRVKGIYMTLHVTDFISVQLFKQTQWLKVVEFIEGGKQDFLYLKCITLLTISFQRVQRQLWYHQWWFLDWGLQQRRGSDLKSTRKRVTWIDSSFVIIQTFSRYKLVTDLCMGQVY